MDISIDKEFHDLIPPLTKEEYETLERSIVNEGCRDAIVTWKSIVVDGHNRFEICQNHNKTFGTVEKEFGSREDVKVWIIRNQFGRRNLPAYERARLALKLEEIFRAKAKEHMSEGGGSGVSGHQNSDEAINTFDEIGKLSNLSHDTIRKVKVIEEKSTPEIKEKLRSGESSIHEAYQQVKKNELQQKREDKKKKEEVAEIPKDIKVLYGDFMVVGSEIPDNSVDLILTDPPYAREYLPQWEKLSLFAKRVLKPSGFLITYSGQLNFNEVIKILDNNLIYYWTFSLIHKGGNQLILARTILCGWKPILIYQKHPFKKLEFQVSDIIMGSGREKDTHEWQQAEDELATLITHFTNPGDIIVDPFAGSGTTVIACYRCKRKPIGIEIDEGNFNAIKNRITQIFGVKDDKGTNDWQ